MPHYTHINISDFGRGYEENAGTGVPWLPTRSEAMVQWFAEHVDFTEHSTNVPGKDAHLATYNANMEFYGYDTDLSIFTTDSRAATILSTNPEWFLHVTDATTINYTKQDTTTGTLNMAAGDPLQVMLWNDARYVYNLKDAALRAWLKAEILTRVDTRKGVMLDEHGALFNDAFKFYQQNNSITAGGLVTEYGLQVDALGAAYHTDLITWLGELRTHMQANGKFAIINSSLDFQDANAAAQAIACGGVCTEFLHAPDGLREAWRVRDYWNRMKQIFDNAGVALMTGNWDYRPPGYSAGNYPSARIREAMFRLCLYYLCREESASSGVAYFDLTLQSHYDSAGTDDVPDDMNDWNDAFAFDIGAPVAGFDIDTAVEYTGTSAAGHAYTVFERSYANGRVLLRPRDNGSTLNWDDPATVVLDTPMYLVNADGTTAAATDTYQINNGEALLLSSSEVGGDPPLWNKGFDFRDTQALVTDPADHTYVVKVFGTVEQYPVTRNSVTFGWVEGTLGALDISAAFDPRLAGVNYTPNDGTQRHFRVDLPETGRYRIRLGLGGSGQNYQYFELRDNATSLLVIDGVSGNAFNEFYDAAGTLLSQADWLTLNEPSAAFQFNTTTLYGVIGTPTALGGQSTTIAYLQIEQVADAGSGRSRRGKFLRRRRRWAK